VKGFRTPKQAKTDNLQKFGRLLRDWRKSRGLNQLEAAAELGVGCDQAKISKCEKGRQMPRGANLTALLAQLKA
jgi:transcriptional regulator with XRE-family HTH domain